jgi:uncharacterized Ntn-hydrolase superfamily protein
MLEHQACRHAEAIERKVAHSARQFPPVDVTAFGHPRLLELKRGEHKQISALVKTGLTQPDLIPDTLSKRQLGQCRSLLGEGVPVGRHVQQSRVKMNACLASHNSRDGLAGISPALVLDAVRVAPKTPTLCVGTLTSCRYSRMRRSLLLVVVCMTVLSCATARNEVAAPLPWPPVATFSILGYDPATGEVGGAVQSRVFSVGNGVLWGEAGVGVVATQAIVDVSYGPQSLALLRGGVKPADVVARVWESDPDPQPERWTKEGRQFSVMNASGEVATYTGPKASAWAGHRMGKFCSAQGNILAGEQVVTNMVRAFENTEGHLSMRLLAALEAGQAAGGDTRGMQSAAMLIVKKDGGVWLHNDVVLRLQVDDNPEPIRELRRLVEKAGEQRARVRR